MSRLRMMSLLSIRAIRLQLYPPGVNSNITGCPSEHSRRNGSNIPVQTHQTSSKFINIIIWRPKFFGSIIVRRLGL